MRKDSKLESHMSRNGFSVSNFANNKDGELKRRDTSEPEEKAKDERNLRKRQATVLETTKKSSRLRAVGGKAHSFGN